MMEEETTTSSQAFPYQTPFAEIAPRFTGSLSAIASSLIIVTILKSDTKLKTVYHRIMFFMSCADISGSIAMALTSLPMPKHMSQEIMEIDGNLSFYDNWAGIKLGNTQTCEAQGFFYVFGVITMYAYNAMMCIYYVCAIGFGMREDRIIKNVEPFLHLFSFTLGFGPAVFCLVYDLYNPSGWEAWCTASPIGCNYNNEQESKCIRGMKSAEEILCKSILFLLGLIVFIILASLVMVTVKVIKIDRALRLHYSIHSIIHGDVLALHPFAAKVYQNQSNTKVILIQSLCYIFAFMLTLLSPAIQALDRIKDATSTVFNVSAHVHHLYLVFVPLQGFFNFVIFIGHKVYAYRRGNPNVGIFKVIKLILQGKAKQPIIFTRISMVQFHHETREMEIRMDDEFVHEECSHIFSESGDIVEPIHSQVEFVNEGRLSYPSTFRSAAFSAGNDVFRDDDRSSNDDLSGFDESASNVGSSTGLSSSNSRHQQKDTNSTESC